MRKLFLAGACFLALAGPGFATTIAVTQGSGTNILTKQDGSGNNAPSTTTCDATTPTTCAPVSATTGLGVNLLDGSNVTLGAKADAKSTATDTTPITIMSVLKQISASIQAAATSLAGTLTVATHAVTQSGVWNITNISGTVTLPTGASTSAKQPALGAVGGVSADVLTVQNPAGDPCQTIAKINVPISQAANAKLVSATSAKKTYICSFLVIAGDAENVSLVEGTGSTCGTGTAAIIGGTTAANGPNLAANAGWAQGNGGNTVASGATNNTDICLFQSASGRVAGNLMYVQQ